ncbi:MAG: hypothetical protein AAFU72_16675 [Pseudomonadota bacterium]
MTETIVTTRSCVASGRAQPWLRDAGPRKLPAPAASRAGLRPDAWAFGVALVLTPFLLGGLGFPILLSLFALFSLPAYFLAGGPIAWFGIRAMLRRGIRMNVLHFAALGFVANLFSPLALLVTMIVLEPWGSLGHGTDSAYAYWAAGAFYAPLSGLTFGAIYLLAAPPRPRPCPRPVRGR